MFAINQSSLKRKISKATLVYIMVAMLAGLALFSYPSKPASAAGTIWNCNDFPSFKQAVEAGGLVQIACPGEINVTQTIEITKDTTIVGIGWGILNRHSGGRIFNVDAGKTLTLKNLSLREGYNLTQGGLIYAVNATLYLENVVLRDSHVGDLGEGGAIWTYGSKLTLINTYLWDNRANYGGAIYSKGSTIELTNSNVTGNHALSDGGVFYTVGGSLKIEGGYYGQNLANHFGGVIVMPTGEAITATKIKNATFTQNYASSGGVLHSLNTYYTSAVTMVSNSTFYNNTANYGGVFTLVAHNHLIEVANSTFAKNRAWQMGGAFGIWDGTLQLDNVTVASNAAPAGGNVYTGLSGDTYLRNSIIANGVGGNCAGKLVSLGSAHSLQYPGSSCGGGLTIGDPDLLPLSDNGGLTRTMALVWGSPAVNAGDNQVCALLDNKDQRGMSRQTFGKTCDIGAFELQGK